MSDERSTPKFIGAYPVLSSVDFARACGTYRMEPGTYRYTGYTQQSEGGGVHEYEEWIEFCDLLETFGPKEGGFEVNTRAQGPNYTSRITSPENVTTYRIGLADFSKSENGMMPGSAYGGVGLLTRDWELLIQIHFAAVSAFEAGNNVVWVENTIRKAADSLNVVHVTEEEMDRVMRAARGW